MPSRVPRGRLARANCDGHARRRRSKRGRTANCFCLDIAELTKVYTAEAYVLGNFYYAPNANPLMENGQWKIIGTDRSRLSAC